MPSNLLPFLRIIFRFLLPFLRIIFRFLLLSFPGFIEDSPRFGFYSRVLFSGLFSGLFSSFRLFLLFSSDPRLILPSFRQFLMRFTRVQGRGGEESVHKRGLEQGSMPEDEKLSRNDTFRLFSSFLFFSSLSQEGTRLGRQGRGSEEEGRARYRCRRRRGGPLPVSEREEGSQIPM